jgi:hypothetical protein
LPEDLKRHDDGAVRARHLELPLDLTRRRREAQAAVARKTEML